MERREFIAAAVAPALSVTSLFGATEGRAAREEKERRHVVSCLPFDRRVIERVRYDPDGAATQKICRRNAEALVAHPNFRASLRRILTSDPAIRAYIPNRYLLLDTSREAILEWFDSPEGFGEMRKDYLQQLSDFSPSTYEAITLSNYMEFGTRKRSSVSIFPSFFNPIPISPQMLNMTTDMAVKRALTVMNHEETHAQHHYEGFRVDDILLDSSNFLDVCNRLFVAAEEVTAFSASADFASQFNTSGTASERYHPAYLAALNSFRQYATLTRLEDLERLDVSPFEERLRERVREAARRLDERAREAFEATGVAMLPAVSQGWFPYFPSRT
jgi:hypothetical protein